MGRIRVTQNDLLEALRRYGKADARRPVGDGWYTREEMAKHEGVSTPAIAYALKCAQRRGVKIETAAGTTLDADGRAKRTTYYRVKP
jgi:hypothetical protein